MGIRSARKLSWRRFALGAALGFSLPARADLVLQEVDFPNHAPVYQGYVFDNGTWALPKSRSSNGVNFEDGTIGCRDQVEKGRESYSKALDQEVLQDIGGKVAVIDIKGGYSLHTITGFRIEDLNSGCAVRMQLSPPYSGSKDPEPLVISAISPSKSASLVKGLRSASRAQALSPAFYQSLATVLDDERRKYDLETRDNARNNDVLWVWKRKYWGHYKLSDLAKRLEASTTCYQDGNCLIKVDDPKGETAMLFIRGDRIFKAMFDWCSEPVLFEGTLLYQCVFHAPSYNGGFTIWVRDEKLVVFNNVTRHQWEE